MSLPSENEPESPVSWPEELTLLRQRVAELEAELAVLRRREQTLCDSQQRLQEALRLEALGVLAGGVAHTFNNLLTVVLGNASLIESDLPDGSPLRRLIEPVVNACWRGADLCRQMLAYSGRGHFLVGRIDLGQLIRDVGARLRMSLSRLILFRLELADSLPLILGDASQLRQMVSNLATNAGEAIGDKPGEVCLRTRLLHADRGVFARMYLAPELPEGDYVCLEVSDTGCGMDPATLEKIFDPYFTTKFLGRGLGLAAVLGIVRGHQGAIQVESEPGRGSTFRVLLPPVSPHGQVGESPT